MLWQAVFITHYMAGERQVLYRNSPQWYVYVLRQNEHWTLVLAYNSATALHVSLIGVKDFRVLNNLSTSAV